MYRTKLSRRRAGTGLLFAAPSLVGLLVFFLVPFGICFVLSFSGGVGGSFIGLHNYENQLQNGTFQLALRNTGKFILVAVPLIMLIGLGISLLLHLGLRGSAFFRTVFLFPYVLPVASVILFFRIVFEKNGLANGLLAWLHLPVTDWLNTPQAFSVLVLLYIWKNCGYNIVLFLAALNSIPRVYYEAAEIDGASRADKLRRITLPLILPYLLFIFIISVINSFKVFREAYILCGAYPPGSIYMLQHFMNNNFQNANFRNLSAGAILVFLFVALLGLALSHLRGRGNSA